MNPLYSPNPNTGKISAETAKTAPEESSAEAVEVDLLANLEGFMEKHLNTASLKDLELRAPVVECEEIVKILVSSKVAQPFVKAEEKLKRMVVSMDGFADRNRYPVDLEGVLLKFQRKGNKRVYRTAHQVHEDVVRLFSHVLDVRGKRHWLYVRAKKLCASFWSIYQRRVRAPAHQGMSSFSHGDQWLGHRVRVYWEQECEWFTACIDDYDGGERYHVVYEDDGLEEWLQLPSVAAVLIPFNWTPPTQVKVISAGDYIVCEDQKGGPRLIVYHALVKKVDLSKAKAFVHFTGWHHSHDQWLRLDTALFQLSPETEDTRSSLPHTLSPLSLLSPLSPLRWANGRYLCIGAGDVTPRAVARKLCMDEEILVAINYPTYPGMTATSKLRKGTSLMLPLDNFVRKRLAGQVALKTCSELRGGAAKELDAPASRDEAGEDGEHGEEEREAGTGHSLQKLRRRRRDLNLYGKKAVEQGAERDWMGAQVVVDCVDARHLGMLPQP